MNINIYIYIRVYIYIYSISIFFNFFLELSLVQLFRSHHGGCDSMNPFPMPLATSGSPMLFGRLPTPAKGRFGEKKISRISTSFRVPVLQFLGRVCICYSYFRSSWC